MKSKYTNFYVSDEYKMKAALSESEAADLAERTLRCPNCGHVAAVLYEDLRTGHMSVKCSKCYNIFAVNFEYFRRPKNIFFNPGIPLRFFMQKMP